MRNFLILVAMAAVTFSACTSSTDNKSGGKNIEEMEQILTSQMWRFDFPKINKDLDAMKSKISPAFYESATKGLKRVQFASFEFAPNHQIKLNLNNGSELTTGTWVFDESGENLIIAFSSTSAIPHKIRTFTKDEIYLESNIDNGAIYPKVFIPLAEGAGLEKQN